MLAKYVVLYFFIVSADNCPAGTKANVTCEPCPIGYYTAKKGLWKTCVECDEDKTTLPTDTSKCISKYRKAHISLG